MSSTFSTTTTSAKSSPQISDAKALTHVLSRLEPKILSTDPHNALRYSAFERTKTLANLEYARTLLLRSEHNASSIKVQTRKHALQETLLRQRALIKKLSDRLFELGQLDDGKWGTLDSHPISAETELEEDDKVDEILWPALEDSDEGELAGAQTKLNKATSSLDTPRSSRSPRKTGFEKPTTSNTANSLAERRAQLLGTKNVESSGLRARGTNSPSSKTPSTTSTTTSIQPANSPHPSSTIPALETAESTHADLTSSLVSLATQLKLSAQAFNLDLAADAEAVSRTEDALGKNKTGLDVATQRMSVLRRMSEGRWWWGRMVLYAGIGVLWIVLVLLVFMGPKIRL